MPNWHRLIVDNYGNQQEVAEPASTLQAWLDYWQFEWRSL